jgi:arylmalonate decarboxylase
MTWSRRRVLLAGGGVFVAKRGTGLADRSLGLILPVAGGAPAEALAMYPSGVRFVTEALAQPGDAPLTGTLATYERLQNRIGPAARALRERGAEAIVLLATSVTFYKGAAHNQRLIDSIRSANRLPATTMSSAIVDGLRSVGARRLAVASGYTDVVGTQFGGFLQESGFQVVAMKGLGLLNPRESPAATELEAFALDVFRSASGADALVLAFASTRTLELIAPLEKRCGVPVVSARPHAFWSGVRLLGLAGTVQGFGTVLAKE